MLVETRQFGIEFPYWLNLEKRTHLLNGRTCLSIRLQHPGNQFSNLWILDLFGELSGGVVLLLIKWTWQQLFDSMPEYQFQKNDSQGPDVSSETGREILRGCIPLISLSGRLSHCQSKYA